MRQAASELWRRIAYCAWHCHWQRPTDVVLPLDSCRCMGDDQAFCQCDIARVADWESSPVLHVPPCHCALRSARCTLHSASTLYLLWRGWACRSMAWHGISWRGVAWRGAAGQGGSTAKAITAAPRAGRGMQTRLMERGLPMGGESVGGMRRGGTARALNHASCFMLHASCFMFRGS